jgi:predicted acylesterase/phospholipase RssA
MLTPDVSVETTTGAAVLARVGFLAHASPETLAELAARVRRVTVHAGDWLFRAGEEAEALYVVGTGRLRVVAEDGGAGRVLQEVGPGGVLGELALLTGSARSASVQAVRDSELYELAADAFAGVLRADPELGLSVARELARQLQAVAGREAPPVRPAVIAVRAVTAGVDVDGVARLVAAALERFGPVALLDGSEGDRADRAAMVDRAEREHAHLVLADRGDDGGWSAFTLRQADRALLVARAGAALAQAPPAGLDLVVVGDFPTASLERLLDDVRPRAHHLVGEGDAAAVARLARRIVGRSLGVVCSGGGARGLAHIGVLDVLEEEGFDVDRLGGCSMGALIAGMAASGWSAGDIHDRCHEELVRRSPFNDYTIPRVALIRSRKAGRMLERLFGDGRVEELPLPLFTVSADLLSSRQVVFRRGPLAEAVGTSMCIPGIAPPVPLLGALLVDGGVLNNLPVDEMAAAGEGPIVAVDVIRRMQVGEDEEEPRLPSIVETLARATVLASVERAERNRGLADLVVTPEVQHVPLRSFGQLDEAVAAGREAARAALEDGGREALVAALESPAAA